jgi:hypothetical protein
MQVPDTGSLVRETKRPLGSARPFDAAVGEVEAADLVGRAVTVLHGAQQAQAGMAFALELADDVDQVFEQPRSGDRAVLGHMAHEQGGHALELGRVDQEAATSRTWVTPPADPSTAALLRVCTESTMSRAGLSFSTCPAPGPGPFRR